jgi:hypothetical protein
LRVLLWCRLAVHFSETFPSFMFSKAQTQEGRCTSSPFKVTMYHTYIVPHVVFFPSKGQVCASCTLMKSFKVRLRRVHQYKDQIISSRHTHVC